MATANATNKKNFVWSDEEVELLLQTTLNYKTSKAQQGIDWESCQSKYTDIWTSFIEQYPTPADGQPRSTAYPHTPDEVVKTQISSKLKSVRSKYREAVDSQRRSGHGRVIALFFELCNEIWCGSPATNSLEAGIETAEVNGDAVDECSEASACASFTSDDTDATDRSQTPNTESPNAETPSTQTPLQRRRGLLQVGYVLLSLLDPRFV